MTTPSSLESLIEALRCLPGIGPKSAQRMAYYLMQHDRPGAGPVSYTHLKPIATLERGTFFGELALPDDAPRSAQARAAENCTLAVFFRGDFLNLMHSHALIASKIALQLARHLGVRLRGAVHNGQQSGQHS